MNRSHARRWATLGCGLAAMAAETRAGRYEALTEWAAKGPKMQVAAASFFGSASPESLVDVVQTADGTIVAFGNAYGPEFPPCAGTAVLGQGTYSGADPFTTDKNGRKSLKDYTTDAAGFLVFYDEELKAVKRATRFGWGVATVRAAALAPDGRSAVVSGYCAKDALRAVARGARQAEERAAAPEEGAAAARKKGRAPAAAPAAAYVMRVKLGENVRPSDSIEWCWLLETGADAPADLWLDAGGNVFFAANGFIRIAHDGAALDKITDKGSTGGQNGYLGFDPVDGGYFIGGDRNTNTGHQPWRSPFLYKYDGDGKKQWTLWEWPPRQCACGGDGNGLCADSSIRRVIVGPDGDLLMVGWSDGGNSVFTRQPKDLTRGAGQSTGPFTTYGMKSANSLAYLLRIDPKTFEQRSWSYWMAYVPDNFSDAKFRGAPNGVGIDDLKVLPDRRIALTGGAATGLISTPNAFYRHTSPNKYGGLYAAVLNADFSGLLFSSYLPGYATSAIAPAHKGLVIVGTTRKDDGRTDQPPTPPPVLRPLQKEFAGGEFDGHIILLHSPPAK